MKDAIYSVLNQTVAPNEFIIIDDGSTDNSRALIQEIVKKHPHIRFIKNEENIGITRTTNKAVELASGDYIGLLASDDLYLPNFIEKNLMALNKYPDTGILCSSFSYFRDENINDIKPYPRSFNPPGVTFLKEAPLIKAMRSYKFWIPSPAFFRRSLFFELGKYNELFGEYTDFFLFALMSFHSGVCFIPEIICAARIHKNQMSKNISLKKRRNSWGYFLRILSTHPYKKYKTSFKKSHLLILFETPVLYYLLKNPQFWSFADYSLWKKLIAAWKKQALKPFIKNLTFTKKINTAL